MLMPAGAEEPRFAAQSIQPVTADQIRRTWHAAGGCGEPYLCVESRRGRLRPGDGEVNDEEVEGRHETVASMTGILATSSG
jgi:hypothetical protein